MRVPGRMLRRNERNDVRIREELRPTLRRFNNHQQHQVESRITFRRGIGHHGSLAAPSRRSRMKMDAFAQDKQKTEAPTGRITEIDEEKQIFQQVDLFSLGFSRFEEIRRQGKLCDVTLKVDDQSFSAHRIVLAVMIPYFKAMFLNNMMESKQKDITLQGIDAIAAEALINFAYSGRITLTNNNVQSIMVGAAFFQLLKVKDACADFLKRRFHPQNALGIRRFADTLSCAPLMVDADKYIQQYFHEVALADEFFSLTYLELKELVSRDELHVVSEEKVFEAVMRWIKYDSESRVIYLPELLSLVRLPLLTPHYLADHIAKEELIRSSHQCRDLLDEARDYHLMPERRHLVQTFRSRPRCCNYMMGHIFAVGGLTKYGDSLSTVEVYDPFIEKWQTSEAMMMLRSRVGVAVHKNKLYAFGGYNGLERLATVEVYDPAVKSWKIIAPMHCKRSAVGTAALNNYLYVCGGYDGISSLNTVERYCPEKDKWRMISPMNKYRSAGGVVAFQGCIYALGGHDGLSIFDSVERYDPKIGVWTSVKSMLTRRCRLGVATLNGKLYVCGGYDGSTFLQSVEVYDPVSDKWNYVAPMNVMRSRAALVANMGKLWAIGGYDGVSNLSTVEVYDPEADSWSFAASMCAHEGGVGVGVIPIC
ncbi:kelch-like protein 18 [Cephus cinctus]|uniref:Kelch-like protein diablo n=1 Tax=Cephus cinctus TaxID=211228 RepID=A0AAJ7C3C5_CEPCN|nr:kelch-like protein 18 [Cephus cinctus]XP_015600930.1 kelch-like protein 18 [Cephus cinctus]XP_015600931.1 kelch-like protein 18 [Cephus cinctus]